MEFFWSFNEFWHFACYSLFWKAKLPNIFDFKHFNPWKCNCSFLLGNTFMHASVLLDNLPWNKTHLYSSKALPSVILTFLLSKKGLGRGEKYDKEWWVEDEVLIERGRQGTKWIMINEVGLYRHSCRAKWEEVELHSSGLLRPHYAPGGGILVSAVHTPEESIWPFVQGPACECVSENQFQASQWIALCLSVLAYKREIL